MRNRQRNPKSRSVTLYLVLIEELLEVVQTLWAWLPEKKKAQLPLFRRAIGKASFAFREETKPWIGDEE